MKKLTFFLLLFIWIGSLDAQAFIKGAGVRYDMGIPSLPPWSLDHSSELVIDVLTRKMYQWDRVNDRWVLSSSNPEASLKAFDPNLSFTSSKYYQPFTATDSITFTADTTSGFYGAYTFARINFGEQGQPIMLDGEAFDSLQIYNIRSGDTLRGIQLLYFENTPYGVSVNAPNNTVNSVDTLPTGGSSSPAQLIPGLLFEFDGRTALSEDLDTTIWIDQSSFGRIGKNSQASTKPALTVDGPDFSADGDQDDLILDQAMTLNPSTAFSITIAVNLDTDAQNYVFGKQDPGLDYFLLDPRDATNNNVSWATNGTGANWTTDINTGINVVQITCQATTCELWVNDNSHGTASLSTTGESYDVLGNWRANTSGGLNGIMYYFSAHSQAYTSQERTDIFNYINTRFSLGL